MASPSEGVCTPNSLIMKSDTDNENIETNIIPTAITNADRFSVEALMMKQEAIDPAPIDFSYRHAGPDDDDKAHNDSLQRTFQNLKYLFVNYAMNNVPNFSS